MKKTILSALVTLFCVPTYSHASATCSDVYASAVRNVALSTRQFAEYNYLFTQHCEANGELRSSSASADLTTTIKIVDVEFSGSKSEAVSKMREFCKTYNQRAFTTEKTYNLRDEVVADALKTFNECRQLEINGVYITHQTQEPRSVIVSVDFNPAKTTLFLRAVEYDPSAATCRTTGLSNPGLFSDAPPVVLTKDMAEKEIGRPFSIVCARTLENSSKASSKFSRFTLGVDTNHGTYSLHMPAEEVFGFDLASKNKIRNEELLSGLQEKESEISRLNDIVATLTSRINNASSEPHAVVQGKQTIPGWEHSACPQHGGNLANYIQGVCGGRKISGPNKVREHVGDTCGYNYFVFSCLNI